MDPVKRGLAASDVEGVLAQVAGGIVDHFAAPCALALGATPLQVALLSGAPKLVCSAAQPLSCKASRRFGGRLPLLVAGCVLQGAALLFAARALWTLFLALALFQVLQGLMYPAWASLMSEYLTDQERAGYFGRRSRLLSLWSMGSLAVWGLLVRGASAFGLLFAAAGAVRAVSSVWMGRMAPRPEHEPRAQAATPLPTALLLYTALGVFALQLSAPLEPVLLLVDMRAGYRTYTLIRLCAAAGAFGSYALWGKWADKRGSDEPLRASGWLNAAVCLAWAVTRDARLLCAVEVVGGAAAAGFSLCALTRLIEETPAEGRQRALAAYGLACGVAAFAGSAVGGRYAGSLPALFAASAALRASLELGGLVRLVGLRLGLAAPPRQA